jgi:hypothetical protein
MAGLQPSYLPTPPTAQATTYTPAQAGSTGYNAATYNNPYDPAQATSELTSAAGVQDRQQQQALMSMLAAQGISPGSSAAQSATQNLSTTQNAALDPSLASAQEYGAGLQEQSGLANAGALNTARQFGAGAANTAALANQGATNTAGQFGASASNQMTLQNLQDLLQSQEFNAGAFNNAQSQQMGFQNTDWLAELQAQFGLQDQGLNTAGNLAGDQAQQTVPMNPSLFSDITRGLGAGANVANALKPVP